MSGDRSSSSSLWRSLRHRNFKLYFAGQLVSLCGTWMQQVAQGWLIYRLTGSAALLGVVGFASQIPVFLLGPIAGVVVDRFSRRRIALVTQSLALLQALLLAALTLGGWIRVSHIALLGAVLGLVNAFDMPARQTLVNELVDIADLPNAIALNSTIVNAARIIGPSVAGLLVATLGEGICFLINALSYLAVIWALLAMRLTSAPQAAEAGNLSVIGSLREGLGYVRATSVIRDLLLLLGLVGFMGMPYMTLMPIFAGEVLKGGADALGLLMAAVGCGAVAGALLLARRSQVRGLGRLTAATTGGFGLGLMIFALSRSLWLSMATLLGVGFSWMILVTASNTLLQTFASDPMRGRVMSLFSTMLVGMAPLGSLLAGGLAELIGAPWTVALNGFCCLLGGLVLAARLPRLREAAIPILLARGIIVNPTAPAEVTDVSPRSRF